MLRRSPLRQPLCVLRIRRLASTASFPSLSRNPSTALATSLKTNGLQNPNSQNNPETIQVINPETKETLTVNLRTVKPFTPEFALLPLQFRTQVERRHLLETLRERQQTAFNVMEDDGEKSSIEPNPEEVKKYIDQYLRSRRQKTGIPPDEKQAALYYQLARKKAIKKGIKRLQEASTAGRNDPPLSFEEQWRRRQEYGTTFTD